MKPSANHQAIGRLNRRDFLRVSGLGLGPLLVGVLSDAYADQGAQSIRWALLTAMVTFLLGALCFWRASRPYACAVAAAKPSGD